MRDVREIQLKLKLKLQVKLCRDLDGTVVWLTGAGLAMMDLIKYAGFEPANFLT
jgi:succinyl-CoA synthetase beta subunit